MSASEGARPISEFATVLCLRPDGIRTKTDFKKELAVLRRWLKENVPGKDGSDWRVMGVDNSKFLVCFMDEAASFYFRMAFDKSDYIR